MNNWPSVNKTWGIYICVYIDLQCAHTHRFNILVSVFCQILCSRHFCSHVSYCLHTYICSSFDEYVHEVTSGRLEWSPVHKSEKFWVRCTYMHTLQYIYSHACTKLYCNWMYVCYVVQTSLYDSVSCSMLYCTIWVIIFEGLNFHDFGS